jgi:hypothetical protein
LKRSIVRLRGSSCRKGKDRAGNASEAAHLAQAHLLETARNLLRNNPETADRVDEQMDKLAAEILSGLLRPIPTAPKATSAIEEVSSA